MKLEIDALPTRLRNVLLSLQLTTKKQVRKALRNKQISLTLRNYGILSHARVFRWLGVPITPELKDLIRLERKKIRRNLKLKILRRERRAKLDLEYQHRLAHPIQLDYRRLTPAQKNALANGVSDLPLIQFP